MFKLLLICFLATFVVAKDHRCKFPNQSGIDIQKIYGWWNVQQVNARCNGEDCAFLREIKTCQTPGNPWPCPLEPCMAMDFEENHQHNNFSNVGVLHYNFFGSHFEWEYGIKVGNEKDAGRMIASPLSPEYHENNQDLYILHTDYKNIALIATCFGDSLFIGMMNRVQEPLSEDVVLAYTQIAAQNGFNDQFSVYDHMDKDCDRR